MAIRILHSIALQKPKACGSCKTEHDCIPVGAQVSTDGYWWQCAKPGCHSTLFTNPRRVAPSDTPPLRTAER